MQEYWSGLPFPPPVDLPDPGTEPTSLMSPALVRQDLQAPKALDLFLLASLEARGGGSTQSTPRPRYALCAPSFTHSL